MTQTDKFRIQSNLRPLTLSCLGGLLYAVSFPDFGLWPAAWISLMPLFHASRYRTVGESFRDGFVFGFVAFTFSLSWIRHTMIDYGGLPVSLSLLFLGLLSGYCALFVAAAWAVAKTCSRISHLPVHVYIPFSWVFFEFLRMHLFTGFPWNSLGLSQFPFKTMLQNADWGSFSIISFAIVCCNCVFDLLLNRQAFRYRFLLTGSFSLILVLLLLYGHIRRNSINIQPDIRIGIVQGNTDQHTKWTPAMTAHLLRKHLTLSERIIDQNPEIILWPESAITFYYRYSFRQMIDENQSFGDLIHQFVTEHQTALNIGTLDLIDDKLYNSAVLISPQSHETYYHKEHLVPFGEYIPLKKILFFVNRMVDDSIGEFNTADDIDLLVYKNVKMGMTICYENIFPSLVRDRVRAGANIICNLTNDTWFGNSSAPAQHFSMSYFRAVETRRPVVRAANSGYSGAIDQKGDLVSVSELFKEQVLCVDVDLNDEMTFYVKYGDVFAWLCSIITAGFWVFAMVQQRLLCKTTPRIRR